MALDPRTGAVEVMASTPSYNANLAASRRSYARIAREPGAPLINRAVQYGYAPGSTFKVVTATAAIDTGQFTPESTLSGRNELLVSGFPLKNDNNENFGEITLTEAMAHSVNTVYAQVAERLGKATMARYMRRFGFDHKPQLDYPAKEMSASGEYLEWTLDRADQHICRCGSHGHRPGQARGDTAADGRGGCGRRQSRQADGPSPDLLDSRTGWARAATHRSQSAVGGDEALDRGVGHRDDGSGRLQSRRDRHQRTDSRRRVAGKTGTAETQIGTAINNVWFIAFAPAQNPTVAVAVTLKGVPGQGATFAAPVAKQVMEALLK